MLEMPFIVKIVAGIVFILYAIGIASFALMCNSEYEGKLWKTTEVIQTIVFSIIYSMITIGFVMFGTHMIMTPHAEIVPILRIIGGIGLNFLGVVIGSFFFASVSEKLMTVDSNQSKFHKVCKAILIGSMYGFVFCFVSFVLVGGLLLIFM